MHIREKKSSETEKRYFSLIELAKKFKKEEGDRELDVVIQKVSPIVHAFLDDLSKLKSYSHCHYELEKYGKRYAMEPVSVKWSLPNHPCYPSNRPWTLQEIGTIAVEIQSKYSLPQQAKQFDKMIKLIIAAAFSASYPLNFFCDVVDDLHHKYDITETRPLREVIRERGKSSVQAKAHQDISDVAVRRVFDAICKAPNATDLQQVLDKFPPQEVETISDLPESYPYVALGQCTVRKNTYKDCFYFDMGYMRGDWVPKATKTKNKRTDNSLPLQRDFTKHNETFNTLKYKEKRTKAHKNKEMLAVAMH